MDLVLIRHTRVTLPQGTCYGRSELALADSFADEAAVLRNCLPRDFDRVYTSPLQRCRRLAAEFDSAAQSDERLLEYDFGDWEMTAWNDIDADSLQVWMDDFANRRPPGGETLDEMMARVSAFVDELRAAPAERVLAVTHAGVIRCVLAGMLKIPLTQIFKIDVGYGKPWRFRLGDNPDFDMFYRD